MLITLDTTRADRIGAYSYDLARTPNIDGLAERGVLFEQAMTPVPITAPAHASLLTGTQPPYHGVRTNEDVLLDEHNVTLAEILRDNGFRTGAFVGAAVLRRWAGLNQGFETYWDEFPFESSPFELSYAEKRAEQVVSAAGDWLSGVGEDPYFLWVHLFDPHGPYQPPARFAREFEGRPYDGEIAYADEQIGVLLETLDRLGLRQRTLVAFLSDHGEGLDEHLEESHGHFVYNTTLHIPFILSCPTVLPQRFRAPDPVDIVDFLPTALAVLDVDAGIMTQGRNLLPLIEGESVQPANGYAETVYPLFTHGWTPLHALRRGDWKVIRSPTPQLYNLRDDPDETTSLFSERREQAEQMLAELGSLERQISRDLGAAGEIDSDRLRALKSLGYVGGASSRDQTEGLPVESKDRATALKDLARVQKLLTERRSAEALGLIEALARSQPRSRRIQELWGSALLAEGQLDCAKLAYGRLLEIDPDNGRARMNLGLIAIQSGDAAVARKHLEAGYAASPDDPLILVNLARFYHQELGQLELARPLLERYLELLPNDRAAPGIRRLLNSKKP